jgi:hypothetical protein
MQFLFQERKKRQNLQENFVPKCLIINHFEKCNVIKEDHPCDSNQKIKMILLTLKVLTGIFFLDGHDASRGFSLV